MPAAPPASPRSITRSLLPGSASGKSDSAAIDSTDRQPLQCPRNSRVHQRFVEVFLQRPQAGGNRLRIYMRSCRPPLHSVEQTDQRFACMMRPRRTIHLLQAVVLDKTNR